MGTGGSSSHGRGGGPPMRNAQFGRDPMLPGYQEFATQREAIDYHMANNFSMAKWQNVLSGNERQGIRDYTSYWYSEINTDLREGRTDFNNLKEILAFVKELDAAEVGGNITAGIAEGMTEAGWDTTAETLATNLQKAVDDALVINSPSKLMKPTGEYVAAGIGEGMSGYDFTSDATSMVTALKTAISAALTGTLRSAGENAMAGLKAGIHAGRSGVVSAMQSAARSAVNAAKKELKIASPSRVFRDEVGSMTMKGFGEGVVKESRKQARIMQNAARYLTDEAKEGSVGYPARTDNSRTYNSTSSVNLSGNSFYIREQQDIRSLAIEIASLTKRQQRGRGLRMA